MLSAEQQAKFDEIKEKFQEIGQNFATEFALGAKDGLIEKIKTENAPKEENPYQLLDFATPDWVIKEGDLKKRGFTVTSWKTRRFVALNADQGFLIEYYEISKGGRGKKKGDICCAGYDASAGEMPKSKKPGIILTPDDDGRRTWYIECANKEEVDAWLPVFKNACRCAMVKLDDEPVVQAGFERSFETVKSGLGIWAHWSFDRPANEMLAKLMTAACDHEVEELIDMIPDNPMKTRTASMVSSMIATAALAAATPAWEGARAAFVAILPTVEEQVKPLLSELLTKTAELKETIKGLISSVTDPALEKASGEFISPVVTQACEPIVNAFKQAIKGWKTSMDSGCTQINEGYAAESVIRGIMSDCGWWYWRDSPMFGAHAILDDFERGVLAQVVGEIGGLAPWRMMQMINDALESLLKKATHTFAEKLKELGTQAAAFEFTIPALVADAKVLFVKLVNDSILSLALEFVQVNIITPAKEAIAPVNEAIPDLLKEFINPAQLLEELVTEVMEGAVGTVAEGASSGVVAQIDTWEA